MFIRFLMARVSVISAGILPWDHTHDQDICHTCRNASGTVCVCTGANDGTVGTTRRMTSLTRRLGVGVMNRWLIRPWAQIISDSFKRETTESVSRISGSVFVALLFGVKRNDIIKIWVSVGLFFLTVHKNKHYDLIHEQLTLMSRFF